MPKAPLPTLQISAEEAVQKFYLREMLFFLIDRRGSVLLDRDFDFRAEDFAKYLRDAQFATTIGRSTSNDVINKNLRILTTSFFKRDKYLKVKPPREQLLNFTKSRSSNTIFTVKNCLTEDLNHAIRYLDIYLMLCDEASDKNRIDAVELERKIGSYNEHSLFGQDSTKRIIFCNKLSERPLGSKERAIFNILKNHFKEDVGLTDIYEATESQTQRIVAGNERTKYINDGVVELRKKLYEISGNPETIVKGAGTSMYKLVY